MSYENAVIADARLRVLCLLSAWPAYTGNETKLRAALAERFGHALWRDELRTELTWLDEQGLLTLQTPGGIYLVTLNSRGQDVAKGISTVPGVARLPAGE